MSYQKDLFARGMALLALSNAYMPYPVIYPTKPYQNEEAYNRLVGEVQMLAAKVGITQNVKVSVTDHPWVYDAEGLGLNNMLSVPEVRVRRDILEKTPQQREFILTRELVAIHQFSQPFDAFYSALIAEIALEFFNMTNSFLSIPTVLGIQCLAERFRAKPIDIAAYKLCSGRGKNGAFDHLNEVKQRYLTLRNKKVDYSFIKWLKEKSIDDQGNLTVQFSRPLTSERIKYLQEL